MIREMIKEMIQKNNDIKEEERLQKEIFGHKMMMILMKMVILNLQDKEITIKEILENDRLNNQIIMVRDLGEIIERR
jgi:hypothetical protein